MTAHQELIEYIKKLTPEQVQKALSHPIIIEAMKKQKEVSHNEA